jgi:hypothetical protein
MKNDYPVFVPTKGRFKNPLTVKYLNRIGVDYQVVIEEPEYSDYAAIIGKERIIVLPHQNEGLTVTRNWIWDYAEHELQTPFFWTFDDNIRNFYRLHKNMKYRVESPTFLKVMEDFAGRYENLIVSGMQYEGFANMKSKQKPVVLNRRVYSNMLIKTDSGYRNELFYNDDTDLCLRVLKDGNCTALFYAFLAEKMATMRVKGGMTDYYEETNKRLQFAQELQKAHPDVTKVVKRYGRWHHQVDYRRFKRNKLKKKQGVSIPAGTNNYGMVLRGPLASKP